MRWLFVIWELVSLSRGTLKSTYNQLLVSGNGLKFGWDLSSEWDWGRHTRIRTRFPLTSTSVMASLLERDMIVVSRLNVRGTGGEERKIESTGKCPSKDGDL